MLFNTSSSPLCQRLIRILARSCGIPNPLKANSRRSKVQREGTFASDTIRISRAEQCVFWQTSPAEHPDSRQQLLFPLRLLRPSPRLTCPPRENPSYADLLELEAADPSTSRSAPVCRGNPAHHCALLPAINSV